MTTVQSQNQSSPRDKTRKAPGVRSPERLSNTNASAQKKFVNPSRTAPNQPPKQLDLFDE